MPKFGRHSYIYVIITTFLMSAMWLVRQGYFQSPHIQVTDVQIRHIAQLAVQQVKMYINRNHSDKTHHLFGLITDEKSIDYTAKVTLKFGYDLKDIRAVYDSRTKTMKVLQIPPIKILDVFIEMKEVNNFKSGWFNEWKPEDLSAVLGQTGLMSLKDEIKTNPQVYKLATVGHQYIQNYIKYNLGLPFDGFTEQLDWQGLDSMNQQILALPSET